MKNFLRSLRSCWPYRGRLMVSVICALLAAVLWGLNFTAIYPVLKILGQDKNLQDWVEERINEEQKQIDGEMVPGQDGVPAHFEPGLQARYEKLVKEERGLDAWEDVELRAKRRLQISSEMSKISSQLDTSRTNLWRYQ